MMMVRPIRCVRSALVLAATLTVVSEAPAQNLPEGYWGVAKTKPLLDKTMTVQLAPDLSSLDAREKQALGKLIEVGQIFHQLYEQSRHHQAAQSLEALQKLDAKLGSPQSTQNLLKLYRLFRGPIATTLENTREPFLPVDKNAPGCNVYPWGVERDAIDTFLSTAPKTREAILHTRTVVRNTTPEGIRLDLGTLQRHPALETLHPTLRPTMQEILASGTKQTYYAVPYAVAYSDDMLKVFRLLFEAAALLQSSDADFAQYLRNRARDLLSNDYESGDAAWITGRFGKLNAQIGTYETYDDELYSMKAFHSTSLLLRDEEQSNALRAAIQGLQEFEDSLPMVDHKRVREDVPVGVYHVIADFGQSRGTNTASILPNEESITRKYGRTILLRYNIMTHPDLIASSRQAWDAVLDETQRSHFETMGNFYRTLWHEIGHYLGADMTRNGRTVTDALEANSSTFEEMKADLVSLFLAEALHAKGYYTQEQQRAVYASGIRRVLNLREPRRAQAYATMQLMQFNWFIDQGLLTFQPESATLQIQYDRYHEVVRGLLQRILALQYNGNKAESDSFIDQWTTWSPDVHEVLAAKMRDASTYRYRQVYYDAVDRR
jgi:hypothetical protein